MEQTRKEYIESELSKWKEKYEIGFEQEFDLKAMFDLQYQFTITSKEHVKSLGDIIHTKNQIMKNLNLKPKKKVSNGETWIAEISYHNIEDRTYIAQLIKTDAEGKVLFHKLNKHRDANGFKYLAALILEEVSRRQPSRLLFDKNGIGLGLYDSVVELLKKNETISLKENGDLIFL